MAKTSKKKLKITLIKSGIARPGTHKAVLKGLGLAKLHHSVIRDDSPQMRGMINKVAHLVRVEES
ncbi:MAG: 50S ribosomal protein L30 [Nitrospirota bacterium]